MLGGLATEQGAARAPAPLGDTFDHRGHALGHDLADGEVVEEEQGFRAGADHVVGAHRHEVDAHGVEATRGACDLELRADAVGRSGEQAGAVADAEQAGESSDLVGHLRAAASARRDRR